MAFQSVSINLSLKYTHTHTRPLEMFVFFFFRFIFNELCSSSSSFFLSSTGNDSFCLSQRMTNKMWFKQLIVKWKPIKNKLSTFAISTLLQRSAIDYLSDENGNVFGWINCQNSLCYVIVVVVLLPYRFVGWLELRVWWNEISCRRGRIMDVFFHQWTES